MSEITPSSTAEKFRHLLLHYAPPDYFVLCICLCFFCLASISNVICYITDSVLRVRNKIIVVISIYNFSDIFIRQNERKNIKLKLTNMNYEEVEIFTI